MDAFVCACGAVHVFVEHKRPQGDGVVWLGREMFGMYEYGSQNTHHTENLVRQEEGRGLIVDVGHVASEVELNFKTVGELHFVAAFHLLAVDDEHLGVTVDHIAGDIHRH